MLLDLARVCQRIKNLKRVRRRLSGAKKEQGEEKQDSTYSIRSTDKVDLEEFDLKSAIFKHMNKMKSANRNIANYRLYHALMEALIADEDAMDKEVADKLDCQTWVRSTKRRRSDSATSGSAHPPTEITDTRDADVDSLMHRSDPESENSEQSSDDIPMQDEGNDSDMEDTDNAHIPKAIDIITGGFRRKGFYIKQQVSPYDREAVRSQMRETYSSGLKVSNKDKTLIGQMGCSRTITSKKITRLSLSQEPLSTEDRNDQRKLMRLNELHKFSDGTLTRVMEKLDHMVKDFLLFEYNKGMETRKWSEDDKRKKPKRTSSLTIEKRIQIRKDLSKS
ncbi:hypothetical protein Tco_1361816 [Tanacetum coccineum]